MNRLAHRESTNLTHTTSEPTPLQRQREILRSLRRSATRRAQVETTSKGRLEKEQESADAALDQARESASTQWVEARRAREETLSALSRLDLQHLLERSESVESNIHDDNDAYYELNRSISIAAEASGNTQTDIDELHRVRTRKTRFRRRIVTLGTLILLGASLGIALGIVFLHWQFPVGQNDFLAALGTPLAAWSKAMPLPSPSPTILSTPTRAATETPTPTHSPTVRSLETPKPYRTEVPQPHAEVIAKKLNVRSGPGTEYGRLAQVTEKDQLIILGRNKSCSWIKVRISNGILGWVATEFVNSSVSPCFPPVVESPPTPTPTTCAKPAGQSFARIYAQSATKQRLGCPLHDERLIGSAFEPFEHGFMFWREDRREIYVLFADGSWDELSDQWREGDATWSCPDLAPTNSPPTPLRGFGRVWCKEAGVRDRIGRATGVETGAERAVQDFQQGVMFQAEDHIYVLYRDHYTWERH